MKVYRWIKTDDRLVAVVRPAALFDTKGFKKVLEGLSGLDGAEVVIKMKHKSRGELATYALAFERGLPLSRVAVQIEQTRNIYEASDTAELEGQSGKRPDGVRPIALTAAKKGASKQQPALR